MLVAASLAGCTGEFDIEQTEPLQVQVNGEPRTVSVSEEDSEPQEIRVDNSGKAEAVQVTVEVRPMHAGPVTVLIIIEDSETGERLAEQEISTGEGGNETTNTTTTSSGNTTTAPGSTTTAPANQTTEVTIQNIFIDVKGKDNFVVLTQAVEGDADVSIAAYESSMDDGQANGTY